MNKLHDLIKDLIKAGHSQSDIATSLQISRSHVSKVLNPVPKKVKLKLTDDEVLSFKLQLVRDNIKVSEWCVKYKVNNHKVYGCLDRRRVIDLTKPDVKKIYKLIIKEIDKNKGE